MKPYHIAATKSSPTVHFDPQLNVLQIDGQSYPENAIKFYEPLLAWIDRYLLQLDGEPVHVHVHISYMNTSSTKCIMMLLDKFEQAYLQGKRIALRWVYNPDNESELECAEELKEDLTLPFAIEPIAGAI